MSVENHRKLLLDAIEDNSIVLIYAGIPVHTNEDDYYDPFRVNSQFFWLTGLERHGMILLLSKINGKKAETLFIEEADVSLERWMGKMPTVQEAQEASGISDVRFLTELGDAIGRLFSYEMIENAYFDVYRQSIEDMPDYNTLKAQQFAKMYPAVRIRDLHNAVEPFRLQKDEDEIAAMRKAGNITRLGLEAVMKSLKPGMMEYQAQAVFEFTCKMNGAKRQAFPTIAGSGINGCMLHYCTNHCEMKDGSLLLMDLGAEYENYCSDVTRTYPVNGKFTDRQRQYYELVLKANRTIAQTAKPGMTKRDLQELTRKILGEGLVEMGKIESVEEVGKYYMHGVSHSLGIDVHDIDMGTTILKPGMVISDEPGLYVDEEEIGIRIEDDLLITEDGCEVLTEDIIRDPDEIEAFMADR